MNMYKKLVTNSLIFAVGNLGTKLITFFLVPLYTYYLTPSEFGMVDLLTTTISFLMPIVTLSIFDAVLRFVMDKSHDKKEVLINSLFIVLIGFFLISLFYPVLIILLPFDDYIHYFYLLLLVQSINTILTQYIRAKGMIRLFALSGIFNVFTVLIFNIALLMIFKMGIVGYLISIILANIISTIFVIISGKVHHDFIIKKVNIKLMKEMLHYSIPLIPNALMWWIMSLSDRYIITYLLGISANGIYAVANKIPSILNIVNSIFFQAWQMSAIEEANSKEKSHFFSNVFNVFSIAMLVTTSLLLVFLKLIMGVFVANSYFIAWKYVPFLLLGVVFSSFSGFLGTNYIATKKTSGIFKTSVIGAILNIVVNLLLVPTIGINGAAIGTMISFAVIWLLRIKDTREFVNIKLNKRKLFLTLFFVYVQIGILYLNIKLGNLFQIVLLMLIILLNFYEIRGILEKIIIIITKKSKQSK
ncbi:lipopolysaccharide biosynthesis protein [Neobacillus massiliamazoniensis]|uniref:Polysaccharide biosynthesis protein n=1 Tax=Neobacillus massiliamazoniensis TaxID=1499688 RepID=A0A0U1NR04_9BACI|nr:oligosaccharide flippase family protein [Neobacillus massiliamazoniensis]CRK80178.1 polysaccharide biosynthesis protein [Neobacillus massiliamazoniensis]